MTYIPKHRGESKIVHRVNYVESERGWGRDEWNVDFDTEAEARQAVSDTNAHNTAHHAPDWYIQATYIGPVTL